MYWIPEPQQVGIFGSGRYNDYGQEMLRIKDRGDRELLYGPSHTHK